MNGLRPFSQTRSFRHPSLEWFAELYGTSDRTTVLLVHRESGISRQLSRVAGHWRHPAGQRLLRQANDAGSDVYCSVNPTVAGSSREVADVMRLQLDLDSGGDRAVQRVMTDVRRGALPMPAVVVRSSRDRWQVLWHAEPAAWTAAGAVETNRRLASVYGGDPAVVDVTRVMRVPGYINWKPGRDGVRVALVPRSRYDRDGAGRQWWEPRAFRSVVPARSLASDAAAPAAPSRSAPAACSEPAAVRYVGGRREPASRSEADWREVVDALRAGRSPGLLIQELVEARPDKHSPRDYAERTVVRACRSLGLSEPDTAYGRRHPPASRESVPAR